MWRQTSKIKLRSLFHDYRSLSMVWYPFKGTKQSLQTHRLTTSVSSNTGPSAFYSKYREFLTRDKPENVNNNGNWVRPPWECKISTPTSENIKPDKPSKPKKGKFRTPAENRIYEYNTDHDYKTTVLATGVATIRGSTAASSIVFQSTLHVLNDATIFENTYLNNF